MPKYINKQTFEFEVEFVVEAENQWDAQGEPLNGLNIVSISAMNTDRPWTSEDIGWVPAPSISKETKNQLTKMLDEMIRLADEAQEVSTREIYEKMMEVK